MNLLKIIMFCAVCLTLAFGPKNSYGYREKAHRAINMTVIKGKLNSDPLMIYFKDILGYSSSDEYVKGYKIFEWFENAGAQEDKPLFRTPNHFLDPVANIGFSGYLFGKLMSGEPTAVWAQRDVGQQWPGGAHSWRDAREYFYTSLISTTKEIRETKLTDSFRALGQVMHLVSDMSVPEHTRDTSHILSKTIEPWLEKVLEPGTPLNEKYSGRMSDALNHPVVPDPSLLRELGKFPGAPIPVANLFDYQKYTGLNPDITVTGPIGLAEYTNANFFSFDTIFKNYDHPAESNTIMYVETDTATEEKKTFIASTEVNHLAQTNVFYKYLVFGKTNGFTLVDDKIFADYMDKLIPRAVGYAGALVDYFYRGTIELSLPTPSNQSFRHILLKAKNTTSTGEELTNPEAIKLVIRYKQALMNPSQGKVGPEPVPQGQDGYHYLVVPLKNSITTIPKDTTVDLEFDLSDSPLPMWSYDVSLQVVYKGQLGNETGAVAVGRIVLPSIHGDIALSLPDKGIYGITKTGVTPPANVFSEIRVKATNIAAGSDAMSSGNFELFVQYKQADSDPFRDLPTDKSPLDPESYYIRVPEINGVTTIPRGAATELVFNLSAKPLPIWATDVYFYVVYTGQIGTKTNQVAIGYLDIAEPTPIDIVNNMDFVCLNGSYLQAGSQAAIDAVGTDGTGLPLRDIYPHRLKDVYLAFTPTPASSSNYSVKIPVIQPGEYGRIYILTDYSFNVGSNATSEKIVDDLHDVWGGSFSNSVTIIEGVANQVDLVNGELLDYYPDMTNERGLLSWWFTHYENTVWPAGTTCNRSGIPNVNELLSIEIR